MAKKRLANGYYKGIKIDYILNYTGDYVLFKTIDGKLHVDKKDQIDIGE